MNTCCSRYMFVHAMTIEHISCTRANQKYLIMFVFGLRIYHIKLMFFFYCNKVNIDVTDEKVIYYINSMNERKKRMFLPL